MARTLWSMYVISFHIFTQPKQLWIYPHCLTHSAVQMHIYIQSCDAQHLQFWISVDTITVSPISSSLSCPGGEQGLWNPTLM